MTEDLYRNLQKYLDTLSIGFPATESGTEIELLKDLFTQEDAELYLNMTEIPETPQEVAARLHEEPHAIAAHLDRMAKDGLLFSFFNKDATRYRVAPFAVGIVESKMPYSSKKTLELASRYFEEAFIDNAGHMVREVGMMRIVPVGESVEPMEIVSTYDQNRAYIKTKEIIAVVECVCRTLKSKTGEGCGNPLDVCMAFDWYADYLIKTGIGKAITMEEALDIQDRCEDAGLVSVMSNLTEGGVTLCHCCSCCCFAVVASKKFARPVETFATNFHAVIDSDSCTGCGICLKRCPMEALSITDETAEINLDRCLGCGVCVPTCATSALRLAKNQQEDEPITPREFLTRLAQARGGRQRKAM